MAVPAPASITVGDVIRGSEVNITWSAVPDAFAYRVQRSVNGASFGDEIINNTTLTSMIDEAGENWNTVQYRVQAMARGGGDFLYSDWTTSPVINVDQPAAGNPPAPASITTSEYVKGQPITITWSPVTFSKPFVYVLQSSTNGVDYWGTTYDGTGTSYVLSGLSQNVNSIQFRVRTEVRRTGNDVDISEWTVSEVKTAQTVTPPTPSTGGARLEQFQNSEGTDIYPRTVMEGVVRRSDGKSLKNLGVFTEGGANLVLNGDFGSAPYTITITETEDDGDGDGDTSGETSGGSVGPQGPQGEKGDKGDTGPGVPAGGTTGQVLTKDGNEDYKTKWTTLFTCGTTDLTAGSSSLATGQIHLVYE